MVKQKCEVFSRVVGYIRPVENWNDSKQQEFKDRVEYSVEEKELIKNNPQLEGTRRKVKQMIQEDIQTKVYI